MITAELARKMASDTSTQNFKSFMSRCEASIEKRAKENKHSTSVKISYEDENVLKLVINELERRGFTAKQNQWYDQRDNYSSNTLDISW